MSETTLTTGNTISPFQGMFHELYSLLEQFKFPDPDGAGSYAGYTGSQYKFAIGTNRNALGWNVDPSAWNAAITAVDFGQLGAVRSDAATVSFDANSYFDGTNSKAKATGAAARLYVLSGALYYEYAASVTAGSNQTFNSGWKTDTNGQFMVGTTTPSGRITSDSTGGGTNQAFWGKNSGGAANATVISWNATTTGDGRFHEFYTEASATLRGYIDFNRGGTAVRYNTTSDLRLKTDVVDAPEAGAIIDAMRVRSFKWKENGSATQFGFIAQELHAVVPDAVSEGDDGEEIDRMWGVDKSALIPLLVREIQSLRARVAALEAP